MKRKMLTLFYAWLMIAALVAPFRVDAERGMSKIPICECISGWFIDGWESCVPDEICGGEYRNVNYVCQATSCTVTCKMRMQVPADCEESFDPEQHSGYVIYECRSITPWSCACSGGDCYGNGRSAKLKAVKRPAEVQARIDKEGHGIKKHKPL